MKSYEDKIKQEQFLQRVNIEKSIIGSKAFYINEDIENGVSIEDILTKANSGKYFDNDTIEKGKPAQVGEVREWNGVKYRKVTSGKWEELRTTGRESSIAVGVGGKGTATQRSARLSQKVDQQERDVERNKEKKKKQEYAEKRSSEIEDEIYEIKYELRDALSQRKQLLIDMEEEVGAAPEEKKDKVGNRYGGELDDLDEKIKGYKAQIEKLEKEDRDIWDF